MRERDCFVGDIIKKSHVSHVLYDENTGASVRKCVRDVNPRGSAGHVASTLSASVVT